MQRLVCDPATLRQLIVNQSAGRPELLRSDQLPRRAEIPPQQFVGFRIADDDFFLRIPFDLATGHHGNLAEVAGDGGVMRGFDWE